MEELKGKLGNYMESWSVANRFSGSILVADGEKVLFDGGYGYASEQYKVKNSSVTKHRIASLTKQFTAVAILKLFEMNKISLDSKIKEYIPEFKFADIITVHQLLCHSSGIPEHTNFEEYKIYERVKVATIIDRLNKRELDFKPGEGTDYSNSNYVLLGRIIEKTTGMGIEDFFRDILFKPLGLSNTGISRNEEIVEDLAQGYTYSGEGKINSDYYDMSGAFGSGFLFSNVWDIYKWTRALLSGEIIKHETLKKMLTPYGDIWYMGASAGYGCLLTGENYKDMSSNGLISGHVFNVWVDTSKGTMVIILGNNDSIAVAKLLDGIKDILLRGKLLQYNSPKETLAEINQEILINLQGKYTCNYTGGEFSVCTKDNKIFVDRLWVQEYKRELYKFICTDITKEYITFCCEVCEGEIQFAINPDNSITKATFKYDTIILPYTRV